MAAVPKALLRSAPTSTTAVTATVPAGYRWIVTSVVVQNITAATVSFTMLLDGVALAIVAMAANAQYTLAVKQVLDAGKVLSVSTSVPSALTIHVSGIEQGI